MFYLLVPALISVLPLTIIITYYFDLISLHSALPYLEYIIVAFALTGLYMGTVRVEDEDFMLKFSMFYMVAAILTIPFAAIQGFIPMIIQFSVAFVLRFITVTRYLDNSKLKAFFAAFTAVLLIPSLILFSVSGASLVGVELPPVIEMTAMTLYLIALFLFSLKNKVLIPVGYLLLIISVSLTALYTFNAGSFAYAASCTLNVVMFAYALPKLIKEARS